MHDLTYTDGLTLVAATVVSLSIFTEYVGWLRGQFFDPDEELFNAIVKKLQANGNVLLAKSIQDDLSIRRRDLDRICQRYSYCLAYSKKDKKVYLNE